MPQPCFSFPFTDQFCSDVAEINHLIDEVYLRHARFARCLVLLLWMNIWCVGFFRIADLAHNSLLLAERGWAVRLLVTDEYWTYFFFLNSAHNHESLLLSLLNLNRSLRYEVVGAFKPEARPLPLEELVADEALREQAGTLALTFRELTDGSLLILSVRNGRYPALRRS